MGVWKMIVAGVLVTAIPGGSIVRALDPEQSPELGVVHAHNTVASTTTSSLEEEGFHGPLFATPAGFQEPPLAINPAEIPAIPFATQFEEFVISPESLASNWRVWGGTEVLLGTSRPANVPPVITTGPASDGVPSAGAIGQPNTMPLFGGRKQLGNWRSGLRAEMGLWFSPEQTNGIAGRFYCLYTVSEHLLVTGNGTNVVNVPQFLPINGTMVQLPVYVGFPGLTTGTAAARTRNLFVGGDLNLRHTMHRSEQWRLEALVGYRQLYLRDELGTDFTVLGSPIVPQLPAVFSGGDTIITRNHFFGPQIGAIGAWHHKRWTAEGLATLAMGANVSERQYDRNRVIIVPAMDPIPLGSASVSDQSAYFGVMMEAGGKLTYSVTDCTRLTFGYTYLCWWNVRRASEQFNLSPSLNSTTTYYNAHMLSWGAEFRF